MIGDCVAITGNHSVLRFVLPLPLFLLPPRLSFPLFTFAPCAQWRRSDGCDTDTVPEPSRSSAERGRGPGREGREAETGENAVWLVLYPQRRSRWEKTKRGHELSSRERSQGPRHDEAVFD